MFSLLSARPCGADVSHQHIFPVFRECWSNVLTPIYLLAIPLGRGGRQAPDCFSGIRLHIVSFHPLDCVSKKELS